MAGKSVSMPRNRTGDSVGTLPFGGTCHKTIYMHMDMCVHVAGSVQCVLRVCVGAHTHPKGGLMDMLDTFEAKQCIFFSKLHLCSVFAIPSDDLFNIF